MSGLGVLGVFFFSGFTIASIIDSYDLGSIFIYKNLSLRILVNKLIILFSQEIGNITCFIR